jgi:CRP-like cAMP-binding protein
VIGALVRSLLDVDLDLGTGDIADVLWLLAAQENEATGPGGLGPLPPPATPAPGPAEGSTPTPAEPDANGDGEQFAAEPSPLRLPPATEPRRGGVPIALAGAAHLTRPLALLRPLRPFRGIHEAGPGTKIDVDATVDATADARRFDPSSLVVVSRPERRRKLDAVLVVDTTPSMVVWEDTAREVQRLLEQLGAFRTVSRWNLTTAGTGPTARTAVQDAAGATQPAERIIDASGHRLVVIFTDAVGAAWYRRPRWQAVDRWARTMPTVIVQVLPRRYWPGTGIGDLPAIVQSRWPACPNSSLRTKHMWWADRIGSSGVALAVPVVALTEDGLETWAESVAAGTRWVDATLSSPPAAGPLRGAHSGLSGLSAGELVRGFDARASEGAYRLARILSAAPVLTLPLIRVLQTRLAPGTGVTELAEVFVAGLLEHVTPAGVEGGRRLRFRPGVAAVLQRGSSVLDEWDMYAAVTDYLAHAHGGHRDLLAVVAAPGGYANLPVGEQPFGEMLVRLGRRLGLTTTDAGDGVAPAGLTSGAAAERRPSEDGDGSVPSAGTAPAPDADRRSGSGGALPQLPFSSNAPRGRLGSDDVEALTRLGVPVRFDRGAALMHQGAEADGVVLLLRGRVKIVVVENGRESLRALRGPGDLVGEMAAFEGGRRSATVVALEPVHAVVVPIPVFLAFVHRSPGAAAAVLGLMASRLRDSDRQLARLGAFPTAVRLARYLLDLADELGRVDAGGVVVLDVGLTQADIAAAIGASRESVRRDLAYLRERGMVGGQRRPLVLVDVPALRSFAGGEVA